MLDRPRQPASAARDAFIFLVLLFAPIFFWAVEHGRSDDVHSVGDAYGWLFRTLFENSSPYKLRTQFGFVSYWTVRVAGVSLVAVRAPPPSRRGSWPPSSSREQAWERSRARATSSICGWSRKGVEIVRELRASEVEDEREIVILADRETTPLDEKGVTFIRGNPSSGDDLRPRRPRARVDGDRARRRVEHRATSPTTSTPARCSRPSRSSRSTTTRTRASR